MRRAESPADEVAALNQPQASCTMRISKHFSQLQHLAAKYLKKCTQTDTPVASGEACGFLAERSGRPCKRQVADGRQAAGACWPLGQAEALKLF